MSAKYFALRLCFAIFLTSVVVGQSDGIQIIAYNPRGVSVVMPYKDSFKNVRFSGKLTTELMYPKTVQFRMSNFVRYGNDLVALNGNIKLYDGMLKYTLARGGNKVSTDSDTQIVVVDYPISITAHESQGFQVSLVDTQGVEGFSIWANINKLVNSDERPDVCLSSLESVDGKWVAENHEFALTTDDLVYPIVHIRRNGALTKYLHLPPLKITETVKSYNHGTTDIDSITTSSAEAKTFSTIRPTRRSTTKTSSTTTVLPDTTTETTDSTTISAYPTRITTTKASTTTETSKVTKYTPPALPKIQIEIIALTPKGFTFILRTSQDLEEVYVWANINKELTNKNNADIKLSSFDKISKEWIVDDNKVALQVGDQLHILILAKTGPRSSSNHGLVYTISNKLEVSQK